MQNTQSTTTPSQLELPKAAMRRHLHDRCITYKGYLRDDGLWDIEGELRDSKPYPISMDYRGELDSGDAVHHMLLRITIDADMVIHDIAAAMRSTPFIECHPALDSIRTVIGLQMGRGWKKKIEEAIGGVQGCTHIRELLSGAATAAYQTVYPYLNSKRLSKQGGLSAAELAERPKHLDQCKAWDVRGPVVMRYFPQFAAKSDKV